MNTNASMNQTGQSPQLRPDEPVNPSGHDQQQKRSQDEARASQTSDPSAGAGREIASADSSQGRLSQQASASATLLPPVDIFENDTGFTVMADMPGVSKDQLVVRVTGDNLVIEGTATVPAAGNMELVYGEMQTPQYRRSFTLSRELDPSKIEAKLNNGVLTLHIPKAEEAKPRRINVSVG